MTPSTLNARVPVGFVPLWNKDVSIVLTLNKGLWRTINMTALSHFQTCPFSVISYSCSLMTTSSLHRSIVCLRHEVSIAACYYWISISKFARCCVLSSTGYDLLGLVLRGGMLRSSFARKSIPLPWVPFWNVFQSQPSLPFQWRLVKKTHIQLTYNRWFFLSYCCYLPPWHPLPLLPLIQTQV